MVRFKKILCPVDFFEASTNAFAYTLKLAANYGAKVHAIHVIAPVLPATYGAPFSVEELTNDLEKEARGLLQKLGDRAGKQRVAMSTEVRHGDVDREILRSVEKQKVDLVVMGTHGRRGFERLVMGSVTERMMRHCPVPLFIVGHPKKAGAAPPNIRRILLTTDFSEGTADAVAYALSIAQESQAKVTLLHVLHDVATDVAGKYRDSLVHGIEVQLQRLIPEDALDWCDVEPRIEEGVPSKVIPNFVKSGAFDLLVMNIHGKGFLDRALLGSTAERTLRAAAEICPVLLIPPPRGKARRKG